jgi:3-oxoacyl-[acyl-carrier protein] reductase
LFLKSKNSLVYWQARNGAKITTNLPKFGCMNLSLEGRTALICGSSQGIGFAIAKELAQMGADCILVARSASKLESALMQLDFSIGQKHYFHAVDFNDRSATEQFCSEILSEKTIHILINNSGGPASGPITVAAEEEFTKAFNQHVLTSHMLTKAVMEGMKRDGYGRIINIISTSVKIPLNNLGVSNTVRGAMASWAKTMANELGQYNITVNNVLPGFTKTERLETIVDLAASKKNIDKQAVENQMMQDVPMKRFGEAYEVAAVAAFLASPAASYVNGVSVPVDGGRTGAI